VKGPSGGETTGQSSSGSGSPVVPLPSVSVSAPVVSPSVRLAPHGLIPLETSVASGANRRRRGSRPGVERAGGGCAIVWTWGSLAGARPQRTSPVSAGEADGPDDG
jgi:hypothetical protein